MSTAEPSTCLHTSHGYSLYLDDGKPYVIRTWTQRKKVGDHYETERKTERLPLLPDNFTHNATARAVFQELTDALFQWQEWAKAMGSAK